MSTFTKGRIKKSVLSKNRDCKSVVMVTEKELRASKSTIQITSKLIRSGQLTSNSVIFDDIVKSSGCNVHLSLIYRDKAPIEFDVLSWYKGKSYTMKERISELMLGIVFNEERVKHFLEQEAGMRMVRHITSDVVTGEDKNLIGYLFNIEYNRL